jgi:hypothetical protein
MHRLRSRNGLAMQSSIIANAFENCPHVQSAAMTYGRAFTSRTIGGRELIAFAVEGSQVSIIGVFYAGQDCESILQADP